MQGAVRAMQGFGHRRSLCLPTHDQSQEHCGIDIGKMFVLVFDTLTRVQRDRSSAVVSVPQTHGCVNDVQFRKESPKCSSGNAAIKRSLRSCVKLAFLISIQPGTSSIVSRFISLSWRVLIPFSNLVM